MSLAFIREFVKARIDSIDSGYNEHNDAFNSDNIGELNLDKAYHIFYANMNNIAVDQATSKDEVNVVVSIYTKTNRYPKEFLDEAFDFANTFRMYCINPKNIVGHNFIKNVKFTSMEAQPLNGNDNAIVIKVNLRFMVIYGYGVDLSCEC